MSPRVPLKHREQAQELALRLRDAITVYHTEQEEAGTPMLLNDILSALSHVTGSMMTNIPEDSMGRLFNDLGEMVLMSYALHKKVGGGPAVLVMREGKKQAEVIMPGGEKEAVQ